jgi:hypothetical protein
VNAKISGGLQVFIAFLLDPDPRIEHEIEKRDD